MNQNVESENGVNAFLGKVAGEKKKAGIALCLIAIMAVMWVRVLSRKGPESSEASPEIEVAEVNSDLDSVINVTYVDLPEVSGRTDMISRDFFATAGWEDYWSNDGAGTVLDVQDVSGAQTKRTKQIVDIMRAHVQLEVIDIGQKHQAFINGKLMSKGDKLVISDGNEMYECEVVEIEKNAVLIRCKDAEIVLKLIEPVEGNG